MAISTKKAQNKSKHTGAADKKGRTTKTEMKNTSKKMSDYAKGIRDIPSEPVKKPKLVDIESVPTKKPNLVDIKSVPKKESKLVDIKRVDEPKSVDKSKLVDIKTEPSAKSKLKPILTKRGTAKVSKPKKSTATSRKRTVK